MTTRFAYITAPSKDEAISLGRLAVEARVAACANVLPSMTSIYRWKDELAQDEEYVLILKTTESRWEELQSLIQAHHSYDCPCIVALPIVDGNPEFLRWIDHETS